jgi:predicted Zn-ribbon and HTH transcriptional regulator
MAKDYEDHAFNMSSVDLCNEQIDSLRHRIDGSASSCDIHLLEGLLAKYIVLRQDVANRDKETPTGREDSEHLYLSSRSDPESLLITRCRHCGVEFSISDKSDHWRYCPWCGENQKAEPEHGDTVLIPF